MQSICVADDCKLLLKILTAVWHRYFQKNYFLLCSWGIYHFHWLICSSNIRYVSIIYSNISLYLSRICFTIINNSNSKQLYVIKNITDFIFEFLRIITSVLSAFCFITQNSSYLHNHIWTSYTYIIIQSQSCKDWDVVSFPA